MLAEPRVTCFFKSRVKNSRMATVLYIFFQLLCYISALLAAFFVSVNLSHCQCHSALNLDFFLLHGSIILAFFFHTFLSHFSFSLTLLFTLSHFSLSLLLSVLSFLFLYSLPLFLFLIFNFFFLLCLSCFIPFPSFSFPLLFSLLSSSFLIIS